MKYNNNLPKIYSFDVFDTCLTRIYAHPTDLFYELAQLVLVEKDKNYSQVEFYQLGNYRILAEKRARKIHKKHHEDISIDQIYLNFFELKQWKIDPQYMLEAELKLEEQSIYPIKIIKLRIKELRRKNNEIIFVSDMYLPTCFIRKCLLNHGVAEEKDSIYVSGDIGLTKHSGNLFKHILQQKNCKPENFFHIGDNHVADFNIPRKLGINVELFEDIQLTQHEKNIAASTLTPVIISSRISAINRINRLNAIAAGAEKKLAQLASNIIAPLLTYFVLWVLENAQKKDIKRLYFVSRDGQILYEIAQKIVNYKNLPIECRYLYGSRRAWLLPSTTDFDQTWRRLVVTPGQQNRIIDILGRLGIEGHQIQQTLEFHNITPNKAVQIGNIDQAMQFLDELFRHPKSRALIEKNIQYARLLTIRYLDQEKLFEDVPWALVDAGWSLNCQAALKRILEASSKNHLEPKGFYIGLARDHLPESLAGIAQAMIPNPDAIFSRRRVVIEHCFTPATHPSTCGYRLEGDKVYPVFTPETRSQEEIDYAYFLQEVILNYVELVIQHNQVLNYFDQLREIAIRVATNFISNPSSDEAGALINYQAITDLRHESVFSNALCNSLTIRDVGKIIYTTFSHNQDSRQPTLLWIEGSSALSAMHIRLIIRAILNIHEWLKSFKS